MISLTIDGKVVRALQGKTVLWAALDNGIYIPNLCSLREVKEPAASCRLCFVEIAVAGGIVTACTEPVSEGMIVNTNSPRARRLARTAAELLLASHPVDCAHCPSNGSCELQRIAKHLNIKLKSKRLRQLLRDLPIDSSSPVFIYDPNKCVLCGRCIQTCRDRLGIGVLGFAHRGFNRIVTTFADEPVGQSRCQQCGQCVTVCPVGALVFKESEDGLLVRSKQSGVSTGTKEAS